MTQEKSITHTLRFPKGLYKQIEALADANNLNFTQATVMLLTSSIKEPKLGIPKKIEEAVKVNKK